MLDLLIVLDERVDRLGTELGQFTLPSDGAATEAPARRDEVTAGSVVDPTDKDAGPVMANANVQ